MSGSPPYTDFRVSVACTHRNESADDDHRQSYMASLSCWGRREQGSATNHSTRLECTNRCPRLLEKSAS